MRAIRDAAGGTDGNETHRAIMVEASEFKVETIPELDRRQPGARRAEFFRYYNHKRISHQVKQMEMLKDVEADRLTEVGSYLGFATALFMAAGFTVRTVDIGPVETLGQIRPLEHVRKNVLDVAPEDFAGQDVIVCCETLEHLFEAESRRVLEVFRASGAPWLLVSVPYRCASLDIRWTRSRFSRFLSWTTKLPTKRRETFVPQGPKGHKWELGYKGYPLDFFTGMLNRAGYRIEKTDFVPAVQSVMMLCRADG